MLALLELAPAASRSATRTASLPARPKAFMALAVMIAACSLLICAAADNCRTPRAASMLCSTDRPDLLSSSIANAASLALVPGNVMSAPSSIALAESAAT